jgi:diguanylate cyclase (GGDEF)-like protein
MAVDHRPSIVTIVAVVVLLFGIRVDVGWLVHVPLLMQPIEGDIAVVFNTGLSFALAGLALAHFRDPVRARSRLVAVIGGVLVVLASLALAEVALGIDLGIDLASLHDWLGDPNPHPGRMAADTSGCFLIYGLFLILIRMSARPAITTALELLAFLLVILGVAGLLGNWLDLEFLYSWRDAPRMALPTGIGVTTLGIGAWLVLRRNPHIQSLYAKQEEWILTLIAGEILTVMILGTGLAVFAVMHHGLERSLRDGLRDNIDSRSQSYEALIRQAIEERAIVSSRPALISAVAAPDRDGRARAVLANSANSLLEFGFKQIDYQDRSGRRLVEAGQATPQAALSVRLEGMAETWLAWDEQSFVLIQQAPMLRQSELVGWIHTEQYLPALTNTYLAKPNRTGNLALCAAGLERTTCFPTRLAAAQAPNRSTASDEPPGMALALAGESGVVRARDQRGETVIAAYAPLGSLGLGLVLKLDIEEFYAPIRHELEHIALLLLLFVLGGTVLLNVEITPLARKLRRMATLDGLTGAHNRGTFMRLAGHQCAIAQRHDRAFAVLMIDADHFKAINDTHGHDVGDIVLRHITTEIQGALRGVDILGRVGGEEFALALPETTIEGALTIAERLRAAINRLEVVGAAGIVRVTVSIGVAALPGDGPDLAPLLKAADQALYAAKGTGRNRVVTAVADPVAGEPQPAPAS